MIRSMNKYAFLVFHSDYEGFLHKLRSLGVLHVNEQKDSREVEELRGILSERTHIKDTLRACVPIQQTELPSFPSPSKMRRRVRL